ncbi:MAG TPA: hypothetical protein VH852_02030 [Hyphomicrobium sp.]|jgi:hypothetical protein
MAIPWTLEKELCGLADAAHVRDALCRLGILEAPSPEPMIEEVHGWMRGGAETFIYRFRVAQNDAVHDVLLKAVVAFSTAKSLAALGEEWVERRRLLDQEGIRTPRLYHAGRALVVEEFIPEGLSSYLRRRPTEGTHLFDQVIRYAAALEKHGFCPIEPFHGLRTDGVDVFAVDFGQDLGPPGVASKRGRRLLREAIKWLNGASRQSIDRGRATAVFAFHAADGKCEGIT